MPNPKTVTITVVSAYPNGDLELAIEMNTNDSVDWVVEDGSGVSTIDDIVDTIPPVNIFSNNGPFPKDSPGQKKKSKNWSGTINPDLRARTIETYYITYTADSGTQERHDPKIIGNP